MTRDEAIKALTIQLEYWEQLKEKNVLTDHEGNNVVDVLKMAIEALQAEPVKHGKWTADEKHTEEIYTNPVYCSVCGKDVVMDYGEYAPYCPH